MANSNLTKAIKLLVRAKELGIKINYANNELTLEVHNDKNIEEAFLHELKTNKTNLLAYFIKHQKADVSPNIPVIKADLRPKLIPLSYGQERLWFIHQLEGSTQYHIPLILCFKSALNFDALKFAIKKIVARHDVLRTVILQDEDSVYQKVLSPDLWNMEIKQKDESLSFDTEIKKIVEVPFDLTIDYMLRGTLLVSGDCDYALIIVLHHIAFDGWSMPILMHELTYYYNQFKQASNDELPQVKIQYSDYCLWQRSTEQTEKMTEEIFYWSNKLNDFSPLKLPADYQYNPNDTTNGSALQFQIDSELYAKLQTLNISYGATMFMTLVAAFKILLSKYSGQTDISIGSVVTGRNYEEIEDLIGFFVNTIILRSDLSGNPTFTQLLSQVSKTTFEAYRNQNVPYERILDTVIQDRTKGQQVIDTLFVLQNISGIRDQAVVAGIKPQEYAYKSGKAKFGLTFTVSETPTGLSLNIEYGTSIYSHETIRRMAGCYIQLLKSIVSNPTDKIGDLELLTELEQAQLLNDFNNTNVAYPDATITDIFNEQVANYPDLIALTYKDCEISYSQLDKKSNQLAAYILRKGLQKEQLVGICIDKGVDMIVSILAVLKCGGVYIPIDPDYPSQRIEYILYDSDLSIIITNNNAVKSVNSAPGVQIINLDIDQLHINNEKTDVVDISVKPCNAAYVIYTSGSTGKPKGVVVEHKNVVRLFKTDKPLFDFKAGDVWTLYHSFSFDFSVWEIFGALLFGGKLEIISKITAQNSQEYFELLKEKKVTILNQTPSAFYNLIEYASAQDWPELKLRYVIFGGEALNSAMLKEWYLNYPYIKLINMYGITETTVHVTYKQISKEQIDRNENNIGKPIPTLSCYILDDNKKLVPIKVPGEMYVGGKGLSRGYLNQQALTKEKFIDNPFIPGELIYKSGDKARLLENGDIEYIGRYDDQVKIRGHRIELGEIESCIRQYDDVEAVVVLARANCAIDKDLVSYLVAKKDIDISNLREHIARKLPAYMIPSYYFQLATMPITDHGKIDKKALLKIENNAMAINKEYLSPRNKTEVKLAEIWQLILGFSAPGVKDDFFELGGHSLKATRLASQIHKELNVKIALKELFLATTLEQQAELINKSRTVDFINIPVAAPALYYPLSSAQKRIYFMQAFSPDSISYNMPMVKYIGGSANLKDIAIIINKLIDRHESLRTSFVRGDDGVLYQKIVNDIELKIDEYTCNQSDFFDYFNYYIKPFDLSSAPLMRVSLVNVTDIGYVLIVDIHHIVADGISCEILANDFEKLRNGEILPALKLQYKDYSTWQYSLTASVELDHQRSYWLNRFADGVPIINFPTDFSRPEVFSFQGAIYNFRINAEDTAKLKLLIRNNNATLQTAMLSVLSILFQKYTSQNDFVIGCGIAGRKHADLANIVGMFVNSLPIRTKPQKSVSFLDLYKEITFDCLEAYDNQDIQFEDLVDMLKVERDAARNPVFDMVLNVLNFRQDAIEQTILDDFAENNLALKLGNDTQTSKFDMTWYVLEEDQEISIKIEYYSAIFDHQTIVRLSHHFNKIIYIILESPDILIQDINILDEEEKQLLLNNFIDGESCDFSQNSLLALIENQFASIPDYTAVIDQYNSYTYGQLQQKHDQLANFLRSISGDEKGLKVGVLQTRSCCSIESILGIMKANLVYVPLEPEYPEDRLAYMLKDAEVNILITGKENIELANKLQWRHNQIKHVICIDSADFFAEQRKKDNTLMSKDLWDHVGDTSTDSITGGGWMSSYTGEFLSAEEMDEYAQNAYLKLKPYLHADMRVLEIGCASGITMFQLAPDVKTYIGTDLSSSILAKTGRKAKELGFENISLVCMPANEIDTLQAGDFDLIIINSVIQCFNGHNYLRDVLVKAISKLKNKGLLFVGDVMDEDKREAMIADFKSFKDDNKDGGYRTKNEWFEELFVSRDYFTDLIADGIGIKEIAYTDKIHTISNELTRYRYDALFLVDKNTAALGATKNKYQHDVTAINNCIFSAKHTDVVPQDIAYILYTSGSTGVPKGVVVQHGAIANTINAQQMIFKNNVGAKNLQFASLCFDASIWEIFMSIAFGGELHIVSDVIKKDPDKISDYITNNNIDIATLPPAYLNLLDVGKIKTLKKLITAGEAANLNKATLFSNYGAYYNAYGPTESSICATIFKVDDNEKYNKKLPIGKPIANTSVYILNDDSALNPIGVVGEICIAGNSLALGYLNRTDLTDEKFIPNPYNPGEKLYRTGDLGRWLWDGNIEFIGRNDDQVKIRGYRIELQEIEQLLENFDGIKQITVAAIKDQVGDGQHLIGYVVVQGTFNREAVISYLRSKLPEYMVPLIWVEIEKMPLSTNGKINKRALPSPNLSLVKSLNTNAAAESELTGKIRDIWEKLLGITDIDIDDNFFDIGGHSLLATQVVSAIRTDLNIEISISDLFEYTTVNRLEEFLTGKQNTILKQSITTAYRNNPIPLSYGQERLWFIDKLEGSVQYHMPTVLQFDTELNKDALKYALSTIIQRHEVLRTAIKEDGGNAYQYILGWQNWCLNELVFENVMPFDLNSIIKNLIESPFDLSTDYMLRVNLLSVEAGKHILVVVIHHIAADGWSVPIFTKELMELYTSFVEKRHPTLLPLKIQYADYASWQRHYLNVELLESKLKYWTNKLNNVQPLNLPTDYVRPAIQDKEGAVFGFKIEKDLSLKLEHLSQEKGTTLFMTLLAVFKVLLFRYSGQQDICVGSPVAGRSQQEVENLIGFFINTLVLRSSLTYHMRFDDLLKQIKNTTLEAYDHQDVPFEKIVEASVKTRDMSRSPLFQVMFILQNTPAVPDLHLGKTEVSSAYGTKYRLAKYDLTLSVTTSADGIFVGMEYRTSLYNEDTIQRMAAHYLELLKSAVLSADAKLGELEIMPENEKVTLLKDFNNTLKEFPGEETIVALFEKQVQQTPNGIAVVTENGKITYKELNKRADELSFYLKEQGVLPEMLVPICLGRGVDMVIAILAILKCGGAYVPMDPDFPKERINYMIEDTAAPIILTTKKLQWLLGSDSGRRIIALDMVKIKESPNQYLSRNFITPKSLAYVIYTSGSTGKPKGVMVEHASVTNFLLSMADKLNFDESSRFIALTTYSFDIAYLEIYLPLITGGKLYIPNDVKNGLELVKTLSKCKPSHIQATPAGWQMLLSSGWKNDGGSTILVGGEALKSGLKEQLTKIGEVYNLYGPTETTIWSTIGQIKAGERVTIGAPISNTQIYILDSNKNLCPIGIYGDLFIAGAGLARGYLNKPALTEERFIDNPFNAGNNLLMYHTGDTARWLANGTIEFGGRTDDQVKVRGYRIELGEIENVILQSKLVKQAIVIVREDETDNNRLVAYIVKDELFNKNKLQVFLKSALPEYMIPSLFIEIEEMPLTSNGKIDKKALPSGIEESIIEYVAPQTESQKEVVKIWQALLKINRIGIHDNFFELGGNSLLIPSLLSKINSTFFIKTDFKSIYQYSTIADFDEHVLKKLKSSNENVSINQVSNIESQKTKRAQIKEGECFEVLHRQKKEFVRYQISGVNNTNVHFIIHFENLSEEKLENSITKLIRRHESLRTVYAVKDDQVVQKILPPEYFKPLIERLTLDMSNLSSSQIDKYYDDLVKINFNYVEGPLLSLKLIETDKKNAVLLVVLPHINSDRDSIAIMKKEILDFYNTGENPRESNSPSVPQYRDHALRVNSYARSLHGISKASIYKSKIETSLKAEKVNKLANQHKVISYKTQLTNELKTLKKYNQKNLKMSFGSIVTFNPTEAQTITFYFEESVLNQVKAIASKIKASQVVVLTACFTLFQYFLNNNKNIRLSIPISTRDENEYNSTVGWLTNDTIVCLNVANDKSLKDFIVSVRDELATTTEFNFYPHEQVLADFDMRLNDLVHFYLNLGHSQNKILPDAERVYENGRSSVYALKYNVIEYANGLSIKATYSIDKYKKADIEKLSSFFEGLVGRMSADINDVIFQ